MISAYSTDVDGVALGVLRAGALPSSPWWNRAAGSAHPAKEYLAGILPGLDRRTLSQAAALAPARWFAARG